MNYSELQKLQNDLKDFYIGLQMENLKFSEAENRKRISIMWLCEEIFHKAKELNLLIEEK